MLNWGFGVLGSNTSGFLAFVQLRIAEPIARAAAAGLLVAPTPPAPPRCLGVALLHCCRYCRRNGCGVGSCCRRRQPGPLLWRCLQRALQPLRQDALSHPILSQSMLGMPTASQLAALSAAAGGRWLSASLQSHPRQQV